MAESNENFDKTGDSGFSVDGPEVMWILKNLNGEMVSKRYYDEQMAKQRGEGDDQEQMLPMPRKIELVPGAMQADDCTAGMGAPELSAPAADSSTAGVDHAPEGTQLSAPAGVDHAPEGTQLSAPAGVDHAPEGTQLSAPARVDRAPEGTELSAPAGVDRAPEETELSAPAGVDRAPEGAELSAPAGVDRAPEGTELSAPAGVDRAPEGTESSAPAGVDRAPEGTELSVPAGVDRAPEGTELSAPAGVDRAPEGAELSAPAGVDRAPEGTELSAPAGVDHAPEGTELSAPAGVDRVPEGTELSAPAGVDRAPEGAELSAPAGVDRAPEGTAGTDRAPEGTELSTGNGSEIIPGAMEDENSSEDVRQTGGDSGPTTQPGGATVDYTVEDYFAVKKPRVVLKKLKKTVVRPVKLRDSTTGMDRAPEGTLSAPAGDGSEVIPGAWEDETFSEETVTQTDDGSGPTQPGDSNQAETQTAGHSSEVAVPAVVNRSSEKDIKDPTRYYRESCEWGKSVTNLECEPFNGDRAKLGHYVPHKLKSTRKRAKIGKLVLDDFVFNANVEFENSPKFVEDLKEGVKRAVNVELHKKKIKGKLGNFKSTKAKTDFSEKDNVKDKKQYNAIHRTYGEELKSPESLQPLHWRHLILLNFCRDGPLKCFCRRGGSGVYLSSLSAIAHIESKHAATKDFSIEDIGSSQPTREGEPKRRNIGNQKRTHTDSKDFSGEGIGLNKSDRKRRTQRGNTGKEKKAKVDLSVVEPSLASSSSKQSSEVSVSRPARESSSEASGSEPYISEVEPVSSSSDSSSSESSS